MNQLRKDTQIDFLSKKGPKNGKLWPIKLENKNTETNQLAKTLHPQLNSNQRYANYHFKIRKHLTKKS